MSPTADEVIERLERATHDLRAAIEASLDATQAALALARSQAKDAEARLADDDDWRRMPGRKEKSEGGWSLRKLQMQIAAGVIRKKKVVGFPYYSAADVRRVIAS